MTYFNGLVDAQTGKRSYIDPQSQLKVMQTMRLCGPNFHGTTLDTNFWATSLVGSGAASQVTGTLTLATGATANSAASVASVQKARFMFVCPNQFRGAIKLPDTGTANNVRRWGCFDANEGVGFSLNGSTFGVFHRLGGSDTTITSGSFNGPGGATFAMDTNVHFYEIVYYVARIDWYIDGVLYHSVTPTTTRLYDTLTNPITVSNVNSGGSTSNVSIDIWNASVLRFGAPEPATAYAHLNSNATTVLKRGSGHLHLVCINTKGGASNTLTLYDNTAASGSIIAVIDTVSTIGTLEYHVDFFTGLTAVVNTGSAADITVLYD